MVDELLPKDALEVKEAAEYLGLSPATLAGWRYAQTGPTYYKTRTRILYSLADLDAWYESQVQRVEPAAS